MGGTSTKSFVEQLYEAVRELCNNDNITLSPQEFKVLNEPINNTPNYGFITRGDRQYFFVDMQVPTVTEGKVNIPLNYYKENYIQFYLYEQLLESCQPELEFIHSLSKDKKNNIKEFHKKDPYPISTRKIDLKCGNIYLEIKLAHKMQGLGDTELTYLYDTSCGTDEEIAPEILSDKQCITSYSEKIKKEDEKASKYP